jgi:hypothetical protein
MAAKFTLQRRQSSRSSVANVINVKIDDRLLKFYIAKKLAPQYLAVVGVDFAAN